MFIDFYSGLWQR